MRSKAVRQLQSLLSQWTCITHIHCHGTEEAGVLEAIEQILVQDREQDESSLYAIINCLLVKSSLRVLVEELLRQLNLKRHGKKEKSQADYRIGSSTSAFMPSNINCEKPTFSSESKECIELLAKFLEEDGVSGRVVEYIVKAVFFETRDANRILEIIRLVCAKYTEKHGDINEIKNMKLLSIVEALNETDCFYQDENERDQPINLPLSSKYVLIASFCASHNPPSTDKRYFLKFHGKEKRSEARERRAELSAEQREADARSVDLQRIKCIYLALINLYPVEDIDLDFDINMQIATLCTTGLIARTTSPSNLDQPRFRCLLSFENVNEIAQDSVTIQASNSNPNTVEIQA
ncbi:hypothetical protein NECAME_05720 [Necator americanus]|uniref:Origin recognition complex subunit 5 C-terminal domain-containing protein n=1 Tax=Necator americanus TaxID=51031 RepID=W2TY53_NECAM|nr:hypothetical protein NECAME_05720 [Necator americanus]ETN87000.1 hypothetical protein NECAME_05720 [Necator americanus]